MRGVEAQLTSEGARAMKQPKTLRIAVPRDFSLAQATLALSLYCYVSDEDYQYNRQAFLTQVRDRIDMDLQTGDY